MNDQTNYTDYLRMRDADQREIADLSKPLGAAPPTEERGLWKIAFPGLAAMEPFEREETEARS